MGNKKGLYMGHTRGKIEITTFSPDHITLALSLNFFPYLWIQLETQLNVFSKLDFGDIKEYSKEMVIFSYVVLITNFQLQNVLESKKIRMYKV